MIMKVVLVFIISFLTISAFSQSISKNTTNDWVNDESGKKVIFVDPVDVISMKSTKISAVEKQIVVTKLEQDKGKNKTVFDPVNAIPLSEIMGSTPKEVIVHKPEKKKYRKTVIVEPVNAKLVK